MTELIPRTGPRGAVHARGAALCQGRGRGGLGGGPGGLLFVKAAGGSAWEALARPAKRCRPGAVVVFGDGQVRARVVGVAGEGRRIVELEAGGSVREVLERYGLPPPPPHITRHPKPRQEDWERGR